MDPKLQEKIRKANKADNDIILTGCEFRQYAHISTRKMKFLMDNDIVPHVNTGRATHKYGIRKSDADDYIYRTKHDKTFLEEYKGFFSTRRVKPLVLNDVSLAEKKERAALTDAKFKRASIYFTSLWHNQPEILTATIASELIGSNRQFIRRLQQTGRMDMILVKGVLTLSKQELIRFVSKKENINNPPTMKLKEIIDSM